MDNIQQNEILGVLGTVVTVLLELHIPYMLTGSLASGIRGVFRATNDIDFVAAIDEPHIGPFCGQLQDQFFVDDQSVERAVREERSFNIIHQTMLIKVDFFVRRTDPRSATQIRRASFVTVPPLQTPVATASPEDVILSKLRWFEMGSRVSERQWRDILGVMDVNAETLDRDYLAREAEDLGLRELLREAFKQTER